MKVVYKLKACIYSKFDIERMQYYRGSKLRLVLIEEWGGSLEHIGFFRLLTSKALYKCALSSIPSVL